MLEKIKNPSTRLMAMLGLAAVLLVGQTLLIDRVADAQTNNPAVEETSPVGGNVPGGHLGTSSDAEMWRAVRGGIEGTVSIPDKQAGQMIQSGGEDWRSWRNGPLTVVFGSIILAMIGLIALFFLVRGRVKIDAGPSALTIERFNGVERFAHWLTAVCFIVLALTGLNLLYGKHVLLPALGPEAFAAITLAGKYAHNYLSFGFMVGVVLMFVLWVRHNLPSKYDVKWLAQGGGLLIKGTHPPSKKFNFGQKIIFWCVILGGLSLSLSGIALLFPFQLAMFNPTFAVLNTIGFDLPTNLTAMEEMQLSQLWHAGVGLVLIAIIVGHIYIGSLGMEGAFAAMGEGHVDENWAREHHAVWVAEVKGEPLPNPGDHGPPQTQPAE
jgi:formate dehydrogenase subunit gamma